MLLLTSTSDIIRVITGSSADIEVHASWVDNNAGAITPGRTNTASITTATTTTVVAAPASSVQRNVKHLSLSNNHGSVSSSVAVEHFDGTNAVELREVVLLPGENLTLDDAGNWKHCDSNGGEYGYVPVGYIRPVINVLDYGAKGDGATNDQVAIQAAINAAGADGVSGRGVDVWFPAGVYALGSTLAVPFNNVMLRGAGWQSTVLYATFTTGDILQLGNGTSKSGCGLMNMSVWCNAARTTGASINVNAMNDCLIQNFVINNCFQGVLIQGTSLKVWVDQGEINNAHAADGVGVQVTNGAGGDTYLANIVMSNSPASKPAAGIQLTQAGHVSIIRCNVTSCIKGLHVNPSTSQDVSYLFIDHSLFDSCGTHGAHFNGTTAASSRIRSVMAMNSWFSGTTTTGATSSGIEFTASGGAIVDGLSFIGCRILNNQRHGVLINAGPTNISFTDCSFAGNGAETVNTYDGVNLAANVSGVSIISCKIGQAGTAGNQQRYAINVAAGTSGNIQFINNDCQPNGTVGTIGYINIGTLTGGNINIQGNTPQLEGGMGSVTVAASGAINTTETVISAPIRLGAYALRAGSRVRIVVDGTCTATVANVSTFRVRMGTAGTTSDGVIMTMASTASATSGTAVPFHVIIDLVCRTVGASGTFYGVMTLINNGITGIISAAQPNVVLGTAATGSTVANNYLTVTYQSAATTTTSTFQIVSIAVELP